MFPVHFFDALFKYWAPLLKETAPDFAYRTEDPKQGLSMLFLLLLVPVLIAFFFIIRSVYRHTIGEKLKTNLLEDYTKEAEGYENAGKYVSAANIYENKLKDHKKAAALYERGGDYKMAATLYDILGDGAKAKEMYEKDDNLVNAAEVSVREGEYEDAADLYNRAGKKIDAALALEQAGKRLAAARIFREAGDYENAARLLDEEGMIRESAEMFGLSLSDKRPGPSTMQDFYIYAFKLEKSGLTDKALEVYSEIDGADPAYKDVRVRLQTLRPSGEQGEDTEGKTTIRGFIKSGSMEPKKGLKLWLQILKNLQKAYAAGRPFGLLAPDGIAVDADDAITFLNKKPSAAYVSPEKTNDLELDVRADIYSMGVILYEMLTGSLDGLGSKRVTDVIPDLPDWLDEMVVRCIRKVREDRYQTIEEIFTDIKALSKIKK